MKKIILILSLFLLVGCQNTPEPIVENQDLVEDQVVESVETVAEEVVDQSFRAMVVVEVLNLRQSPSVESEKLGEVYLDSVYQVIEFETINEETWYKISVGDNHEGWMAGWYCEVTEGPLKETNNIDHPGLVLNKHYQMGYELKVSDVVNEDYPYEIYINGLLVEDSLELDVTGSYDYYGKLYDDMGRSVITKTREFEVVESIEGLCYETTDLSSDVVYTLDRAIEAGDVVGLVYDYRDRGQVWYEIKPENQDLCYYPVEGQDIFTIEYDHILVYMNDKRYEYSDERLQPITINEDYTVFNHFKTLIVHKSSQEVFFSPYYASYISDKEFVTYKSIDDPNLNVSDYFALELFEISSQGIKSVFNDDTAYLAMSLIEEDETIKVRAYGDSRNHWDYAPESLIYEDVTYHKNNGQWEKTLGDSEFNLVNPHSDVIVYSDMDDNSEVIEETTIEALEEVKFLRNYSIVDNQLVLWFGVKLKDDRRGFVYRPRLDHEKGFVISGKVFSLLLDQGGSLDINPDHFMWDIKSHVSDQLAHFGLYLVSSYYEGYHHKVYSRINGEEVSLPFNSYMLSNPSQTYLLGTERYYGDEDTTLTINTYDEQGFITTYKKTFKIGFLDDFVWHEDDHLSFVIHSRQVEYPAQLRLEDDIWLLETEFDLNDD